MTATTCETSVGVNRLYRIATKNRATFATLITVALLPANFASFASLLLAWLVAGVGQSFVNLPTQTLIADRIPKAIQGRV